MPRRRKIPWLTYLTLAIFAGLGLSLIFFLFFRQRENSGFALLPHHSGTLPAQSPVPRESVTFFEPAAAHAVSTAKSTGSLPSKTAQKGKSSSLLSTTAINLKIAQKALSVVEKVAPTRINQAIASKQEGQALVNFDLHLFPKIYQQAIDGYLGDGKTATLLPKIRENSERFWLYLSEDQCQDMSRFVQFLMFNAVAKEINKETASNQKLFEASRRTVEKYLNDHEAMLRKIGIFEKVKEYQKFIEHELIEHRYRFRHTYLARHFEGGNCEAQTYLIAKEILAQGKRVDILISKKEVHTFAAIDLPDKCNLADPSTWGNAAIVDYWINGKAIPVKEMLAHREKYKMFFSTDWQLIRAPLDTTLSLTMNLQPPIIDDQESKDIYRRVIHPTLPDDMVYQAYEDAYKKVINEVFDVSSYFKQGVHLDLREAVQRFQEVTWREALQTAEKMGIKIRF